MGYHVTILRTDKGKKIPILQNEVEQLISSVDVLKAKQDSLGRVLITDSTGVDPDLFLVWQDGEIWAKSPDEKTIQLMINIAEKLQARARVRGDELETYSNYNESYIHEDDKEEFYRILNLRKKLKSRVLVRKIYSRIAVVAFFIFLASLAKLIFKF